MWLKIDDRLHAHPKVLRAWQQDRAGLGLHLLALSYAGAYLTDGHISDTGVNLFLPDPAEQQPAVEALLDAGLWERNGRGWVIHDFLDYQPPRERVLASRASRARPRVRATRGPGRGRAGGEPEPEPEPIPQSAAAVEKHLGLKTAAAAAVTSTVDVEARP